MMEQKPLITIAVDGFSSSGKSTMAKKLAKTIGYAYIDSGAMYRAVTLYCLENNLFDGDRLDTEALERQLDNIRVTFGVNAEGKTETYLNGRNVETEIRQMPVSSKVSIVAAVPSVRHALVRQQQELGKGKGIAGPCGKNQEKHEKSRRFQHDGRKGVRYIRGNLPVSQCQHG